MGQEKKEKIVEKFLAFVLVGVVATLAVLSTVVGLTGRAEVITNAWKHVRTLFSRIPGASKTNRAFRSISINSSDIGRLAVVMVLGYTFTLWLPLHGVPWIVEQLTKKHTPSVVAFLTNPPKEFAQAIFKAEHIATGALTIGYLAFWSYWILTRLIAETVIKVPAYHYALLYRLGKQLRGSLENGIHFKLPYIDDTGEDYFSLEPFTKLVATEFTTADGAHISCEVNVIYRPDPQIEDENGNVFAQIEDDVITTGFAKTLEAKLGGIGGLQTSEDFVKYRLAMNDLIDSTFRLSAPLHLRHPKNCTVTDCEFKGKEKIDASEVLHFYATHWREVKTEKDSEKQHFDDRSPVEMHYGIDIDESSLAKVTFTAETQSALEKEKQARANSKAIDARLKKYKQVKDELGISGQVAIDAVDVAFDSSIAANKRVVSIQGIDFVGAASAVVAALRR